MAHYARDIFSPRGIEYKYTRTEQKRLFEFFHDDDDGDDDDIDISQLFGMGYPTNIVIIVSIVIKVA